jgi:hypothetical protein
MFVFDKYLYCVFICYIMIIPCCFTKVFKLCPPNPIYYKLYCNIFIDMYIIICDDLQHAKKERQKGLQPFTCCDHGFESHRGHGCLSVVSVVCCQRSLRRAEHSSRGALLTVVCRRV